MDVQTRIKLTIGDLLFQVAVQAARIEELEEQLKQQPQDADLIKQPSRGPNGPKTSAEK